ncbi:MAG: serine/threonine protein kinase [Clostridiales bacterium]|nr:serine/threonine protein kinase [Clostridiales bacterium]
MHDSESINLTVSKNSIYEAFAEDARSRPLERPDTRALTNEKIDKGNFILDTYKVVSDSISGGMGSVWRVHHMDWDIDLAMKRPHPWLFAEASDTRKEDFVRECENWINLGLHPNIVSCYYVREIGGVPSIFSEWMNGGSLKDVIRNGSLYDGDENEVLERVLDIAIQIARGLRYSHEKDLIHQDVKPGNILLTDKWEAKVADFGLAKAQSNLTDGTEAQSSGFTPEYCPKKQAEGKTAEAWMDVYAWALTVAEMCIGRRTWESGAQAEEGIDFDVSDRRITVPESMRILLNRCLKHGKPEGISAFEDVEDALKEIFREVTGNEYRRVGYADMDVSADNLNNYAMSMLDLGQKQLAENAWNEAIRRFPNHVQSQVNRAFFLWHATRMTDRDVKDILDTLPDSPERRAANELFALERGEKTTKGEDVEPDDVDLDTPYCVFDATYEGREHIWLAMEHELNCYDTRSGERVTRIAGKEVGGYLHLVALSGDQRFLYSGDSNRILRFDRLDDNRMTEIRLLPEVKDRAGQYPKESTIENGKQYLFEKDSGKWQQLWLEENDTVLCVIEQREWKDPDDWKKFSMWCQYPNRRTSPVAPRVGKITPYHVLRFRIKSPEEAVLESVTPISDKDDTLPIPIYKVRAMEHPGDRWRAVLENSIAKLQETRTGRYVRSADGHFTRILAFSPDQTQYLLVSGEVSSWTREHRSFLRKTPELGAGKRLYTLCRIKDVGTVQKESEEARKKRDEFDQALDRKDYKTAIRCFEEYRILPERQDVSETIKMELKLSKVCRRTSIHHMALATNAKSEDLAGFDMTPYKEKWFDVQSSTTSRNGVKVVPEVADYEAVVKRAEEYIKSKMPIAYRDDTGEKQKLEGERVVIRALNEEGSIVYAAISKLKGVVNQTITYIVKADLNKHTIRVVSGYDGRVYVANERPSRILVRVSSAFSIHEDSLSGYSVPVSLEPHDSITKVSFLPNPDFLLYTTYHFKQVIIGICPQETGEGKAFAAPIELPPQPNVAKNRPPYDVIFTNDSFHVLLLGEPWLRLGWNYALPEEKKSELRVTSKKEEPEAELSGKEKKGLFSRLFGK